MFNMALVFFLEINHQLLLILVVGAAANQILTSSLRVINIFMKAVQIKNS